MGLVDQNKWGGQWIFSFFLFFVGFAFFKGRPPSQFGFATRKSKPQPPHAIRVGYVFFE